MSPKDKFILEWKYQLMGLALEGWYQAAHAEEMGTLAKFGRIEKVPEMVDRLLKAMFESAQPEGAPSKPNASPMRPPGTTPAGGK